MWYYDANDGFWHSSDGQVADAPPAGASITNIDPNSAYMPDYGYIPGAVIERGIAASGSTGGATGSTNNPLNTILSALRGTFSSNPVTPTTSMPMINTSAFNIQPLIIPLAIVAGIIVLASSRKSRG